MIPIAQALTSPPSTKVEVNGTVIKIYARKTAPVGSGKNWSFEKFKIQDATGQIDVQIWNKPQLSINGMNLHVTGDLEHEPYEGKTFIKIKVNDKDTVLVNGQPVGGSAPAPAAAYQPAPAYQAPAPAPYVPPQAPQQAYQPQPVQQPAPVAPTATAPLNFTQFVGGAENVAKVEAALRESAGLHNRCLMAAVASLQLVHAKKGLEFQPEDVCSVAACLFIDIGKRGFSPSGFDLPKVASPTAGAPAPAHNHLNPNDSDNQVNF